MGTNQCEYLKKNYKTDKFIYLSTFFFLNWIVLKTEPI